MTRTFIASLIIALLLSIAPFSTSSRALATPSSDARRALNMTVPDLNLTGVTLNDALEFLRDISNANFHINWPALEAAGVAKDTPVNIRVRGVAMRKVLTLLLNESSSGVALSFYIDQGVVEITTREIADQTMVTRVYPIEDLLLEVPDFVGPDMNLDAGGGGSGGGSGGGGGGGSLFGGGSGGSGNGNGNGGQGQMSRTERAQQIIDMITSIIEPDIWQINGGRAAIRFFNGSLIVTAPRSVHEALAGPVD